MESPTFREVRKMLKADGWEFVGCHGDHNKFKKNGKIVIVPGCKGAEHLTPGTWHSIQKQVGWR